MRLRALATLLFAPCLCAATQAADTRMLDAFDKLGVWHAEHTNDTASSIESVVGKSAHALRLNFDFKGVIGYATARRTLPLDLPPNYEISFWVRGDAPLNALQFKLIDASGANVWWLNRPEFVFPHEWQRIAIKKRQLEFAWGPSTDRELKHSASAEFVVVSGSGGGKGHVDFDELTIRALPVDPGAYPAPLAKASSQQGAPAQNALDEIGLDKSRLDESRSAAWCSDPRRGAAQTFDIDLRMAREFGGLVLDWQPGKAATRYDVQFSDDGRRWHTVRSVIDGNGGSDPLLLTESETRYVRLDLHQGESAAYCLAHVALKDLAWGASPNAFFAALAKAAPRGDYPRGFVEQPYWTIVGVDGANAPALMSEDGAIEPVKGGYSIEPFLIADGRLLTWADVAESQSLADAYLPMPRVEWKDPRAQLSIDTFADGTRDALHLSATYRVANPTDADADITLALAVRPFQVNPPAQFLNSPGGVSPIHDLGWDGAALHVNGVGAATSSVPADAFVASSFDGGSVLDHLRAIAAGRRVAAATHVHDPFGGASGALLFHMHLPAHGARSIVLDTPIAPAAGSTLAENSTADARRSDVAAAWHARLDRVTLHVPPQAQRLADALRSAHAQILMSRDGPALRPGTRSYARSWIRDGAMIADALLRLGEIDAVREYAQWYAPHQFSDGKVPCCVDRRGADPVPENDSEGEFIHLIAQLYRYHGDRAELERYWPRIEAAIVYMDRQRAGETGETNGAFRGLMPASISHEGYSAKPMHSYWDDFWALTGYSDATDMAAALGRSDDAQRIGLARDAFRGQLYESIRLATAAHGIDYLPGCVELGDFDATSTTIALSPAGEQANLPQDVLHNTFARYWREFAARAEGSRAWNDYTPYEWRTVGSFVRLGWRERAQRAIDFFFSSGARPAAWHQWAEVVGRDPRQIRFIGDMPHAWVASDFIRSTLDLFAYERNTDRSMVLAAGVPRDWMTARDGVGIDGLRTPYGSLSYRIVGDARHVRLELAAGAAPPGGFVLPWPFDGAPGAARIDGKAAAWQGGELHVAQAPAHVEIEIPANPKSH